LLPELCKLIKTKSERQQLAAMRLCQWKGIHHHVLSDKISLHRFLLVEDLVLIRPSFILRLDLRKIGKIAQTSS
jgi:hypothetical protein